ncbi:MAG: hypothetical protein V4574_09420 [Pseudomonadota bacterium]
MIRLLLLCAFLCVPGVARAEWHRAESPHFIIQAELPEGALRKMADELETIDALMRMLSGPLRANRAKATILVVPDIAVAGSLTGIPGFTGGITMDGDMGEIIIVSGDAAQKLDVRRSLFHEYGHSFMARFLGNAMPGWFVEGFATYFQTARVIGANRVRFGAIPDETFFTLKGAGVPFADIMSMAAERTDGPPPAKLYAQGWLMTHNLLSGGSRANEIRNYIRAVSAGEPVTQADSFFAGGVAAFDKDMTAYLNALPPPRNETVPPVDLSAVTVRAMRPGEARFFNRRLQDVAVEREGRGNRAVRTRSAGIRYQYARTLLAEFPDEPELGFYAARLALAYGECTAADTLAETLLAADPGNPTLMAFKSQTLVCVARELPRGAMPLITRSRELVTRAAAIDPDNPAVAMAMFRNYSADQGATPATRRYLDRAVQLNPRDTDLLNTALEFALRNEDIAYAIRLLTPIANSPHDNESRKWAIHVIAELRKRRAPPAPVRRRRR